MEMAPGALVTMVTGLVSGLVCSQARGLLLGLTVPVAMATAQVAWVTTLVAPAMVWVAMETAPGALVTMVTGLV